MSNGSQHIHRRVRVTPALGGVLVGLAAVASLALAAPHKSAREASHQAAAAMHCVPAQLNRSDVLAGTNISASPLPGSFDASAQTQISLLGVPAPALSAIAVSGSSSGPHRGSVRAYSQGDGASFVPARAFVPGETVTVSGRVRTSAGTHPFAFQFVVARQDQLRHTPGLVQKRNPREVQHFHSAPGLQPPLVAVSRRSAGTSAPGSIFIAPYNGPGQSGPEIFNETGELVWFEPLSGETVASNLQVQQLDGDPVLSWWQGYIRPQGFGEGEEIIDNSAYRQVGRVHAGNGYSADLHEFHITPDDTALLSVFNPIECDLSKLGGPAQGAVTDSIFQEIDLHTGLVRREWHSLDHVGLSDSYSRAAGTSAEWPLDYFHLNSIDQLPNGRTLISARNTWSLYELNTVTGQVLLRAGGKRGELKGAGAGTAYQHDATMLANGTISVFDNGAVPKVQAQSRAMVVKLDPAAHSDTLIAQYAHPSPALSSGSQGNVQDLADGNLFVGWGSAPYFSEFTPSGRLLYDAHMHGNYQSYRAYRFPWSATPAGAPAIAAANSKAGGVTVYASWNGATAIAGWRVLGGASASALTPLASAAKSGFETAIAASSRPAYVAVQALGVDGSVLGQSATVAG